MDEERLEEQLARLERERQDADKRYNDALTALDRALPHAGELPAAPPTYDASRLGDLNQSWNVLPGGPPAIDGSFKGRLRAFVWRLVGPPLQTQLRFNAALVDHLNRNAPPHDQATHVTAGLIAALRSHLEAQAHFQALLLQYLQTFTLYIDTRDRSAGAQARVVNAGLSALADDWLKRWESLAARERRIFERVAALDDLRDTAELAQQSSMLLKREVERLLASDRAAASAAPHHDATGTSAATDGAIDLDAYKYVGFQDRFRGSPEEIRERLSSYLPVFKGAGPVLDVGCGRGELLALFREHGIAAKGIDLNGSMVEICREQGHEAERADALALRSVAAGTIARGPDRHSGGGAPRAVVSPPVSGRSVPRAACRRTHRARDDQSGLLGRVLR